MNEGLEVENLVTGTGEQTSSSGTQRKRTPSVGEPDESVVQLLLSLLDDEEKGYEVEIFAFSEEAEEAGKVFSEEQKEQLGLPEDVNTMSWEDLFGLDVSDYEYVSYPKRDRGEDGVTYVDDMDSSDFTGDLTGDTKKALNGHYAEEIQQIFGSDGASPDNPTHEVAIRCGKQSEHDDDFLKARKYQRFYVRSADTTPKNVIKARQAGGEISESEAEKLLDELEEESEE